MNALTSALACVALTLLLCSTARAQSSINDCEKIQAADAYNQCLAKFGPPAKISNLKPEKPGDVKVDSTDAAAGAGKVVRGKGHRSYNRRHGRGHAVARRGRHGGGHAARGGRKRMTIKVGK